MNILLRDAGRLSKAFFFFGLLICISSCSFPPEADLLPAEKDKSVEATWKAMGTFAGLTVSGGGRKHFEKYASVAKETFSELENSLSLFNPGSDISRINQLAGKSAITVSAGAADVLGIALKYAEISRGSFDPTVAPLVRLWGFNGETVPNKPPDEAIIHATLPSIGYTHLTVSGRQVYLDAERMGVDIGGIAKGYAVDVCYRKLAAMGARNIMINLGGNIRCGGLARGNRPWKIGVRNPFNRDEIIGTIILTQGMAVATSGNYERFVTIGNEQYAHIIDPRSGYPVRGMASVTVISTNAAEADGMSTALFVLGMKESRTVLARMTNCHALFIPDEHPMRIYLSASFKKHFDCRPAYTDRIKDL